MTKTISFPSKKDYSSDINELDSRLINLENGETIYQVFQYTGTSQTGTVSIPTEATIFDVYNDGLPNQVVVKADINSNPTEELSKTVGGVAVSIVTFDSLGNYTLSGEPAIGACIVYFIKIKNQYKSNIDQETLVETVVIYQESSGASTSGLLEVIHDATLTGNGTLASPLGVVPTSGTNITGTATLDFRDEDNIAVTTINNTLITVSGLKNITFVPTETAETSLDDFSLNGVTFNVENIIDNTSFNIRGTAVNNASGIYTVNYIITI